METASISGWEDHVLAGCKYLKTARNGRHRPEVFNNELVFQLAAMALEKLMVGLFQYHKQMPADHTLSGLVQGLEPICPVGQDLARCIKEIEGIDDMCPLTASLRAEPDRTAVARILETGSRVEAFVKIHVPLINGAETSERRPAPDKEEAWDPRGR